MPGLIYICLCMEMYGDLESAVNQEAYWGAFVLMHMMDVKALVLTKVYS